MNLANKTMQTKIWSQPDGIKIYYHDFCFLKACPDLAGILF